MANLSNINGKFVVEQTTGYVGVGTTDPNFLIEAAGANSEIALNSTSGSIYRVRSTSSDEFIITKNGVGDRLVINGAGNATFAGNVTAPELRLQGTGTTYLNIGNNTTGSASSDGASIGYFTGQSSLQIVQRENDAMVFSTNGDERMRISSTGDVGIGITTALDKLNVGDGNIRISQVGNVASQLILNTYQSALGNTTYKWFVEQTTSANSYSFQIGNGTTPYLHINSLLFGAAAGNVGIGTTSPSYKLHVSGTGGTRMSITNTDTNWAALQIQAKGNQADYIFFKDDTEERVRIAALDSNDLVFSNTNSVTERMRITSSGQVGIGTPSPQDYDAESDDLVVAQGVNGTNPTPGITIACLANQAAAGRGALRFADGTSGNQRYRGAVEYQHSGDDMFFRTSGSIQVAIDSAGNVGIGNTDPSTKLNVANAGEVIVRSSMTAADGFRGGFEADNQHTGGTIWSMFSTNNSDGYFGGGKFVIANESMGGVDANTTAKFVINGSGNVGIGTTSPSRELDIQASSGWAELALRGNTGGGGSLEFWTNTTKRAEIFADTEDIVFRNTSTNQERMRITSAGHVGIGTTSPNEKLQVAGNIHAYAWWY